MEFLRPIAGALKSSIGRVLGTVFRWFHPLRWLKFFFLYFFVRKQPWLTAGLIALTTVGAGLAALYFPNPAFGANASDWLVALSFGFGLQITGTSVAQVGNLATTGSKVAST